jgi:DNA-binding SARP family transcriptional activator
MPALQFRLFGQIGLRRDGRSVALPPSRKTRALLGYLAATLRPHRRDALCDLLWSDADDPRGALRWSLSRLRPVLDNDSPRLVADRDHIELRLDPESTDVSKFRCAPEATGLPTATVEALLAATEGEFLEGLELPDCWRFHHWLVAEREALHAKRVAMLVALVERQANRPDEALRHARSLIDAAPLSEGAHLRVIRLLCAVGRRGDAIEHFEHASRLLAREAGLRHSPLLEEARALLLSGGAFDRPPGPRMPDPHIAVASASMVASGPSTPLVGRRSERSMFARALDEALAARRPPVLLLTGEPGIGKSRMLEAFAADVAERGGHALSGRAYEAESIRPYGAWIEALGGLGPHGTPAPFVAGQADRERLFEAVCAALVDAAGAAPIALLIDDVQWCDAASLALLHYAARALPDGAPVVIACAARPGELEDNPAALRTLRTMSREGRLREHAIARLTLDDLAALAPASTAERRIAEVFESSGGNPLFALALLDTTSGNGGGLDSLLDEQLERPSRQARELVGWAAALGSGFDVDLLVEVSGSPPGDVASSLGELERRGLLRVRDARYDFMHDLVRRASLRRLAAPRRHLMHRRIARTLAPKAERDDALAGELAWHASLGAEHELAARAAAAAGERCLRLFANAEALLLVERGLRDAESIVDRGLRADRSIALRRVQVLASSGPGLGRLPGVGAALEAAVAVAADTGRFDAAALGHHLLSVIHQEAGEHARAETSTLAAARVAQTAGDMVHVRQLANTARCLAELERDMPRARSLATEADGLARRHDTRDTEVHWVAGLLARWDGELDRAATEIAIALALARSADDHWREYKCLSWLAVCALEADEPTEALRRCAELRVVAARLGDGQSPLADAFEALAAGSGDVQAFDRMDRAVDGLRRVDDKSHLAYVLDRAAECALDGGHRCRAARLAAEAFSAARAMGRRDEATIAWALLALAGAGVVDPDSAHDAGNGIERHSARARRLLERLPSGGRESAHRRPSSARD